MAQASDLDKGNSNVVTLKPISLPAMGRNNDNKLKTNNINSSIYNQKKMEILPGYYELISYNKFFVLRLEEKIFQNISVFKVAYPEK